MKYSGVFLIAALLVAGCTKKGSDNPVAIDPGTGNQNPAVSFAIRLESGTQGMIFSAKPDADVKIAGVIATLAAAGFVDTIANPGPTTVFPKDNWFQFTEYTGVNTGQKWTFRFIGTTSATSQSFVSNSTYDVP